MKRAAHLHQPQTSGVHGGSSSYETVFVARQPVFDRGLETWGYALLYRDARHPDQAVFSDDFDATLKVVANAPLCPDTCAPDRHVLIHFPERSILGSVAHALPPETTVVLASEAGTATPEYLEALTGLRRDGYTIALDGFTGDPARAAQYRLADILCLDVLGRGDGELSALVEAARPFSARLLARRVEDQPTLERCRKLGFALFQGYFFKRPQTLSARKISALERSRLMLFQIIEREEPDLEALTTAIMGDVSLSYRLLTFLNSASYSFTQKVTSIRQAVVLAGWKPVRAWLRLLLLTDLVPSERTRELAYLSAQRGKFFERLAVASGRREEADTLFLMGLFSLLEPIFNLPMEEIIEHLPLPDEVKQALCGADNGTGRWLALASAIENSDWDLVSDLTTDLGLTAEQISAAYQGSINWADVFFGVLALDCPPEPDD